MKRTLHGYLGENGRLLPAIITFTGIDADTDLDRVEALTRQYPIEWGVLFSPDRQGVDPRYPDEAVVRSFITRGLFTGSNRWRTAAHICGGHAKAVVAGTRLGIEDQLVGNFSRFQINTADPGVDPRVVRRFAESMNSAGVGILQCRDPLVFPVDWDCDRLYDRSGGRGDAPQRWPVPTEECRLIGYAGGLGPETVAEALARIQENHPLQRSYWLDMETHIRTDDRLDLDKCEAVCRAVYGAPLTGESRI